MNCDEFNEASDYISELENLLIENTELTAVDLAKKKFEIITKYNMIITPKDQNNYLAEYNEYVSDLMIKYRVEYQ
jgi:hypothetical protein